MIDIEIKVDVDSKYHVWLWLAAGLIVGIILAIVIYCSYCCS